MIYLTSDLHGKFASLLMLLEKARFFGDADNRLYILGDVIDRNSFGGIDILKWIMDTPNIEMLLGNHEKMMLDSRRFFDDNDSHRTTSEMENCLMRWRRNGADVTVQALMQETADSRKRIFAYLDTCPLYKTVTVNARDYLLVHGGLGHYFPEKALSAYSSDELLWERPYLTTEYAPDRYTVILGHTPTVFYGQNHRNRMLKTDSWWNIDTGAAMDGGHPMLLCLDTGEAYYMDDCDTAPASAISCIQE